MLKFSKYLIISFIFAITFNVVLPSIIPAIYLSKIDNETEILTKIFGDEIVICSSLSEDKFYISNFNEIGKKQKNKILSDLDLANQNLSKIDLYNFYNQLNLAYSLSLSNNIIILSKIYKEFDIYNNYSPRSPPYFS